MTQMLPGIGFAFLALLFVVALIVVLVRMRRSWLGAVLLAMLGLACFSLFVFAPARARRLGVLPPRPPMAWRVAPSGRSGEPVPRRSAYTETSVAQDGLQRTLTASAGFGGDEDPAGEGDSDSAGSANVADAFAETSAAVSTVERPLSAATPAYAPMPAPPAPRSRLPLPWTVVSVAALAGMIYLGYLFLDAGTRGHYTWTLRAVAVLGFAGLCAALVLLHLGF